MAGLFGSMFGGGKGASAASAYDPSKLSGSDKLMLIGAMMQDVGAGQGPQTLLATQGMLGSRQKLATQRAVREKIAGMVTPGAEPVSPAGFVPDGQVQEDPRITAVKNNPAITGINPGAAAPAQAQPLTINDPRLPGLVMEAQAAGVDVSDLLEVMKANKSEWVNGVRVNPYDSKAPGYIPTLDKGQEPLYNSHGQIVGVRNMDGSVQAAAQMAGAVTGAQEAAKAGYDLVAVPQSDGSTVMMPRSQAVGLLGGGAQRPTGGPRLGLSQAPGEKVYDENAARQQAELDFTRPKAQSALAAMDAKGSVVDEAIKRALGKVGAWSAGPGALLSGIPGTPAKDLQAELETIKANLGFDELQTMRDNSPTGGALGQVAVQELEALRSTITSLDQAQSPEQLTAALKRLAEFRAGQAQRRRDAFSQTYGGGSRATPRTAAPPSRSALEAEMRKRGLIQ